MQRTLVLVKPDGVRRGAHISADGNLVAYDSGATNLVPGDTNGARDVFVFDRAADSCLFDVDGRRYLVSGRGERGAQRRLFRRSGGSTGAAPRAGRWS